MKWDEYKKLTNDQKEEYNFKFADEPRIFYFSYTIIIMLYLINYLFIFMLYLFLRQPELGVGTKTIVSLLSASGSITWIIGVIISLDLIVGVVTFVKYKIDLHKWKKGVEMK